MGVHLVGLSDWRQLDQEVTLRGLQRISLGVELYVRTGGPEAIEAAPITFRVMVTAFYTNSSLPFG